MNGSNAIKKHRMPQNSSLATETIPLCTTPCYNFCPFEFTKSTENKDCYNNLHYLFNNRIFIPLSEFPIQFKQL